MRRYRHQHSAPSAAAAASVLLATPFMNFLSPRHDASHVFIEAKLGAPAMTTNTAATTAGGENLGKRSNRRRLQPGKIENKDTYTEVQCRYWQRIAWNRDEDSSGGLDREEFFGFLNVISLDHFSEDSGGGGGGIGGGSWQDIFNKMATVSRIGEDNILQVSTDGFSTATATGQPQLEDEEAVDPKIEKEQQKYRDEFCKSLFVEMLRGGVDVATMDLAVFTDGIFVSDESWSWESNVPSTTTSTTLSRTTAAATSPAATTTSMDGMATSPAATTTTTSERRTITTIPPVTTSTSATSNFRIGGTTTSNPLPDFYRTTSEATLIITTFVASTTISGVDAFETDSEIDPIDDSENGNIDDGSLSIGNPTNPIAALEQVMLQSNSNDGADGQKDDGGAIDTRGNNTLSTGAIVGVFFGLAAMVVSIVTVVTRHPYFDPCERDEF